MKIITFSRFAEVLRSYTRSCTGYCTHRYVIGCELFRSLLRHFRTRMATVCVSVGQFKRSRKINNRSEPKNILYDVVNERLYYSNVENAKRDLSRRSRLFANLHIAGMSRRHVSDRFAQTDHSSNFRLKFGNGSRFVHINL